MEASAYSQTGTCADGTYTQENLTASMAVKYRGYRVIVYYRNDDNSVGELIGDYIVHDTGSHPTIVSGECVDIYISDYDTCIIFGRPDVYVRLIPPEDFANE